MKYKYNYIIFGDNSWSSFFFHDLKVMENVRYLSTPSANIPSKIGKLLCKAAFSPRRSAITHRIAFCLIKKQMLDFNFGNDNPVCYVFMDRHHLLYNNYALIRYIKRKKTKNRTILYMLDLVSRNNDLDVNYAKRVFDLIITYDKGDSIKYDWPYLSTPFSFIDVPPLEAPPCDVYFCGYAKNRIKDIMKAYYICHRLGLKCQFFIKDCPQEYQINTDDIYYDVNMSYFENIRHVRNSKCILEIMQKGADGFTPRLWEAIMYNKHLITNNEQIRESPYYYEKGCHFMENLEKGYPLDPTLLLSPIVYPQEIKKLLSPQSLIDMIDQNL